MSIMAIFLVVLINGILFVVLPLIVSLSFTKVILALFGVIKKEHNTEHKTGRLTLPTRVELKYAVFIGMPVIYLLLYLFNLYVRSIIMRSS